MNHYLIVYRSITQAQLASRVLTRAGIHHQLQRTPAGLTERGCSYSIRVPERYGRQAAALLQETRPAFYAIYQHIGDGYAEALP